MSNENKTKLKKREFESNILSGRTKKLKNRCLLVIIPLAASAVAASAAAAASAVGVASAVPA